MNTEGYKKLLNAIQTGNVTDNGEITPPQIALELGEKTVNGEVSVDGTAKVTGVTGASKVM